MRRSTATSPAEYLRDLSRKEAGRTLGDYGLNDPRVAAKDLSAAGATVQRAALTEPRQLT